MLLSLECRVLLFSFLRSRYIENEIVFLQTDKDLGYACTSGDKPFDFRMAERNAASLNAK